MKILLCRNFIAKEVKGTMIYLVTYNLDRPDQDYKSLFAAIESVGRAVHAMEHTWFVRTNYTAAQIRDAITVHIGASDKLFVCEAAGWASHNMGTGNWLDQL